MNTPLRRNRDFTLLWSGLVVSTLGSRVTSIAYPLLVLATTGSPGKAGLVGFLATLPYLVVQLPAGAYVDRWNRRRVMIVCDAGRLVGAASIAAALLADRLTLAHVMVVALVEGTLFVFFNLAEQGAVRSVVPAEQLPAALAQNEVRNRGASMAGAPLGGFLFGLGRAVPFVFDAASYVVSLVCLLAIRAEFQEEREPGPPPRFAADIREGLTWLWHQPFLRAAALLVAGSNFLFQGVVLVLIVVASENGASPAQIGLILAGAGVGGVLGSLAAPWLQRRVPARQVVVGANWVWALLMPAIAFVGNPWALGAVFALMAFVGPLWNVVIGAYQLQLTPDRLLARVSSAELLLAFGAIPLGSLAAGALLEWLGATETALVLAGLMLLIAVAATFSAGVRKAPTLDEARLFASA